MKQSYIETLSASFKSLKEIRSTVSIIMCDEEKHYDQLSQSEREGELGDTLGFEIDALDNIECLLDEAISFIEDNLGNRLS